ncbi:uncharacterized protein N7446_013191 [Penicillium canescens]|uniref:Protein kinase domain-containing protein n=1 Tax=Penicillium canescens TaxID=5083 RepID=A0AAD6N1Y5_PENCN|nr:uncharacterized protein N7446_013191 [Penicillium canescens]KAJ6022838.1 hypothetical protein N7460_013233 [Penicillium canescens]KAJ6025897.1 hypothetical protein N7444_013576 [Penicillium canescens]KAJ6042125.1 hypothetical protein N7446_013191 [Penicillium canescens]
MDADSPPMERSGNDVNDIPAETETTTIPRSSAHDDGVDYSGIANSDDDVQTKWLDVPWKTYETNDFPTATSSNTDADVDTSTYTYDDPEDFGDFARNSRERCRINAEPEDNYDPKDNPHVFYPICVGEVLNERYRVENKLGHGGSSTVWMAYDLQDETDVALKIMCSGESGESEISIHGEITRNVQDPSHLVTCLATFLLPGNECDHRVLVLPLRGPSMDFYYRDRIPFASRISAAKQLLMAVESLHKAGIVHRGEFDGQELDLWKEGELVNELEVPSNLRTEDFYLADFGLAMKIGDEPQKGFPPDLHCSPERLHNQDPSFACDMWSYMILFAELYTGFHPFPHLGRGALFGLVNSLGPLPSHWKGLCIDAEDSWYDQDRLPDPEFSLASTIETDLPDADPIEREHARSLMTRMFTFCPEERLTATQLLQDPSFKAIMEIHHC